ncbi:MAG: pyridoxal phosphate-dependent aminotransferase [Polyangiales bacterium]
MSVLSRRSAVPVETNAATRAVDDARRERADLVDLTESNPTRAGLPDAGDAAFAALADPGVRRYDPAPFGALDARAAVAGYYADHGAAVDPARVVLSASTSEAYGWAFKLLCDPGDVVHLPRPGYPLFDELARLEGVTLAHFDAHPAGRWTLDLDALREGITPRSRAVMIVHPANPTGAFVSREERDALCELCAARGLALVVDEVFLDYAAGDDPDRAGSFADEGRCLTLTLSGLSKVVAAPQVKLGWAVASGPRGLVDEALRRMEFIADCWLSVSASAQRAAAPMLAARAGVQRAIRARVARNESALREALRGTALTALPREGGWYAMLRAPSTRSDEAWVEALAREAGVLVSPGYFFDAPGEGGWW